MEISGKVLREVEFRDRLRGYDTDEVDEFLEKVALAIDAADAELRMLRIEVEASDKRALAAEERMKALEEASQGLPAMDDEEIRRTLLLAQRTADLAVREARDEADSVLASARAEAERLVRAAEERAEALIAETENGVAAEAARLRATHDGLVSEIQLLGQVIEAERARLADALGKALEFVSGTFELSDQVREISASQATSDDGMPVAREVEHLSEVTGRDSGPSSLFAQDVGNEEPIRAPLSALGQDEKDRSGNVDDPSPRLEDHERSGSSSSDASFTPKAASSPGGGFSVASIPSPLTAGGGDAYSSASAAAYDPEEELWANFVATSGSLGATSERDGLAGLGESDDEPGGTALGGVLPFDRHRRNNPQP